MTQTSTQQQTMHPYPQTLLLLKQMARMYRTRQLADGSYAVVQPN